MLLVDIVVLRDYFSGRRYSIFRAPLPCDSGDGWCTDTGPAGPDARYFYGVGAMQMLTAVVLLSDVLFKVRHSRDLMQLVSKETHTN